MQRKNIQQKKTAFKFVDMSSEGQSAEEFDKENCHSSYASRMRPSKLVNHCNPCTNQDNSKLRSVCTNNKTTPLKDLQFSTLSLDDPSLEYDQLKLITNEKSQLQRENEELRVVNKQLKKQIDTFVSKNADYESKLRDYEQQCDNYQAELADLKRNSKKLHVQFAKMQKEYENKLLNFELPGSKSWIEQTEKLYSQITQKIKTITDNHLTQLSKQKMNPAVEETISNFISELLEIAIYSKPNKDQPVSESIGSKLRSKTGNVMAYRSYRMTEAQRTDKRGDGTIGEDYRLLSKSIQKLKNMEKDIDESCGSYLKKKVEDQASILNKTIGLDQSTVGGLDRSKSRRKRIFQ